MRPFLLALSLILSIGLTGEVSAAEKLKLNTGTLAPYTTSEHQGFLDLIIAEIFRRIGYEAEVVVYDASARALANANSAVDAGAAMRIKGLEKKYPNLIRVPEKLIDNDFVAYSKRLNFKTANWESLNPYSVGYILGWQIFERNLDSTIKREKVVDPQQLFSLLDRERLDLILYERWQGLWRAREQGMEIKLHEPPLAKREMYIYLHKDYTHLVDKAARALAEMKRDGTYQSIFDKTLTSLMSKKEMAIGMIQGVTLNPVSIEIVTEAYHRLGFETDFKSYPGKRSLVEANSGRVDAELFRIKGMEKVYPNLVMIPVPVNEIYGVVFTRDKTIKVNGWESLRSYKIGVRRGIKFTEAGTKGMDRIFVNTNEELVELLNKGIIDLFVLDIFTGKSVLHNLNATGVLVLEPPVARLNLYHYLNRNHRELAPKLTNVLEDMEREGFMKRARARLLRGISQ